MTCTCPKNDDINLGSKPRLRARLISLGVPVTGATVVLKLRKPDTTEITVSTFEDGEGWHHRDAVVDQAGQWYYQWFNSVTSALEEGGFIVRRSAFA